VKSEGIFKVKGEQIDTLVLVENFWRNVYTAAATKIAPMCRQFFFVLQNGHFLQYFYSVCKGK